MCRFRGVLRRFVSGVVVDEDNDDIAHQQMRQVLQEDRINWQGLATLPLGNRLLERSPAPSRVVGKNTRRILNRYRALCVGCTQFARLLPDATCAKGLRHPTPHVRTYPRIQACTPRYKHASQYDCQGKHAVEEIGTPLSKAQVKSCMEGRLHPALASHA